MESPADTPKFHGKGEERRMSLEIELGTCFVPAEVHVQVLKDNLIIVIARHEEHTAERMSKSKFRKEYPLSEPIDPRSLRAGLNKNGTLIIDAKTT